MDAYLEAFVSGTDTYLRYFRCQLARALEIHMGSGISTGHFR